jgi:hypothetical protein
VSNDRPKVLVRFMNREVVTAIRGGKMPSGASEQEAPFRKALRRNL